MKKIILPILLLLTACISKEKLPVSSAVQQTIIYKTIGDFSHLVPVTMNSSKTRIISYPAPTDLFYEGKLALPTGLNKGYLLDNRGLTANTVFLKYTYEDYSKRKEAPALEEMLQQIAEKYPFVAIYACGPRSYATIEGLNQLIESEFEGCRKIDTGIPMQVKE